MLIPALQDISWVLPYRSDYLTEYFKAFMIFGQPAAYLFVLAACYWYFSNRTAVFLAIVGCFTTFLNCLIKYTIKIPRPPHEYHLIDASSYGFPSGDVQFVATFWIILFLTYRSRILGAFILFLIPNVMMSRVYLGVHSPLDVSVGLIVGIATALVLNSEKFKSVFNKWSNKDSLNLFWIAYLSSLCVVVLLFANEINNPMAVSLGALFGLGLALRSGIQFDTPKPSMYMFVAIITMLAALYIFIPSTLISGEFKWVNHTVKFAFLTYFIFNLVPRFLNILQQDEELRDA